MSTIASRPFKVSPVRSPQTDANEKNGLAAATTGSLARAVTLHLAGKREEALKQLERAVDSGETSPELYRAMGHIQFELEAFADAADSYRSLTELKPQYAKGWFNLGVCLERMEDWDEASQAFHKAATLDPSHLEAHLGLGVSHLRLEDAKSALFAFERVLELAPDHADALFGKAASIQSLGHPDEASEIYQRILDHDPESEESLANLVLIGMSKEIGRAHV